MVGLPQALQESLGWAGAGTARQGLCLTALHIRAPKPTFPRCWQHRQCRQDLPSWDTAPAGLEPAQSSPPLSTCRILQRGESQAMSSQGWNMPSVTQLSRITSMLTLSNHLHTPSRRQHSQSCTHQMNWDFLVFREQSSFPR